jgi:hypothetical protein
MPAFTTTKTDGVSALVVKFLTQTDAGFFCKFHCSKLHGLFLRSAIGTVNVCTYVENLIRTAKNDR